MDDLDYLLIFLFYSQLIQKKSFQSSSTYAPFCPDKTGALSLKDYQSIQNHELYVQSLKDCGFNEEEIQFKLEQEGHVPKVRFVCLVCQVPQSIKGGFSISAGQYTKGLCLLALF